MHRYLHAVFLVGDSVYYTQVGYTVKALDWKQLMQVVSGRLAGPA